jgi:O-antigen/teichoic acid export membrane protein
MSKLQVTRNTAYNVLGQGLPLLVGLITIPISLRLLGTDRFGLLCLFLALLGYLTLLDLGLSRAVAKYSAEFIAEPEPDRLRSVYWSTVFTQLAVSMIAALVLCLVAPALVPAAFNIPAPLLPEAVRGFRVATLALPLAILGMSFRALLEAYQRFDLVFRVRLPTSALIFLIPALGGSTSLDLAVIFALICATHGVSSFSLFLMNLRVSPSLLRRPLIKEGTLKSVLSYGGWTTIAHLIAQALTHFDRFLIAALLPVGAVAYFSAPFDIASRLWIIPSSLATALFPTFSSSSRLGTEEHSQLFASATRNLILAIGFALLPFVAFSRELIAVWLGEDFGTNSGLAFQILLFGIAFNSAAWIPYGYLNATGRPKRLSALYLAEIPVRAASSFVLIRELGVPGAALAWTSWVVGDTLALFILAVRSSPGLRLPLRRTGALPSAAAVGLTMGSVFLMDHCFTLLWSAKVALVVAAAGLLGVMTIAVLKKDLPAD